jgi:hypothetical protein
MNAMQSMTDDKIIKAACALMRSGQATQGDIGRLAGVDRQPLGATRALTRLQLAPLTSIDCGNGVQRLSP